MLATGIGCLLLFLISWTTNAAAEDAIERGQISIGYQYIHVDGFKGTTGTLDIGTTDTHSINLEIDYALTDRWSVSAGIPWITKRYQGTAPHDPGAIVPAVDSKFIDNGNYHSDFQDFHFSVQYLALDTATWSLSPFAYYGLPSNNYTFFAHSAVGQNLWRLGVGVAIGYYPALSDFFFMLTPAYEFVEETQGTNIDNWRVDAEVGYFFSPRLSGRFFALLKEGNGLDFPDDFPPPRNDEWWYQHDRMIKHNYVNVGLGLDWQANPRSRLSMSVMKMAHADQVHVMKYTISVGLSRAF
jgi:hypothetical protein